MLGQWLPCAWSLFNNIPALYPLDATNTPPAPVVTMKNVCRHGQRSVRGHRSGPVEKLCPSEALLGRDGNVTLGNSTLGKLVPVFLEVELGFQVFSKIFVFNK